MKSLWMYLERDFDPEESMFKILKKIEQRNGRMHPKIEILIQKLYKPKIECDISNFEEFKNHFIVLFCKLNQINAKHSTFVRKLQNFLKAFIPKLIVAAKELEDKRKSKLRVFPHTQKDEE